MDRHQIEQMYSIDDNGFIQSAGVFQGQPRYVPYFVYLYLSGVRDKETVGAIYFQVRAEDIAQFPELRGRNEVRLVKTPDGRFTEVIET